MRDIPPRQADIGRSRGTPEFIAWLEDLKPPALLATMHAMAIAFPMLQKRQEWKYRMAVERAALKPTAEELGKILLRATNMSLRLKQELGG